MSSLFDEADAIADRMRKRPDFSEADLAPMFSALCRRSVTPGYKDEEIRDLFDLWPDHRRIAAANGDAIADYARLTSAPFTITEAMRALQLTEGQRWGIDLGRQFGIRDGLYCPTRRWVVVYYAGDIVQLECADRHLLAMAAGVAVERIDQLVKKRQTQRIPVLTEREIAVLRLRAKGFNVPEIAQCMGISVTTARTHVKKMVEKLEAKDLTHVVAQAFRAGILI